MLKKCAARETSKTHYVLFVSPLGDGGRIVNAPVFRVAIIFTIPGTQIICSNSKQLSNSKKSDYGFI